MTKPAGQRLSIYVASDFLPEVRSEFEAAFDIFYAAGDVEPLVELAERSQAGEMFDGVLFSLDVEMRAEQIEALPDSVRKRALREARTIGATLSKTCPPM